MSEHRSARFYTGWHYEAMLEQQLPWCPNGWFGLDDGRL
jgi:hypothetical protein